MTSSADVVIRLEELKDPEASAGMARYGITGGCVYGVRMPALRRLRKELGTSHELALDLWELPCRETRILAGLIGDPERMSPALMLSWAKQFDSWEVCDQTVMNLFDRSRYNYQLAVQWSTRREEFVKRAAYALMALRAARDKEAPDRVFRALLPLIESGAADGRPYVKKAVSWALRNIGKRNAELNRAAVETARTLKSAPDPGARWVGADAFRELTSKPVKQRLGI